MSFAKCLKLLSREYINSAETSGKRDPHGTTREGHFAKMPSDAYRVTWCNAKSVLSCSGRFLSAHLPKYNAGDAVCGARHSPSCKNRVQKTHLSPGMFAEITAFGGPKVFSELSSYPGVHMKADNTRLLCYFHRLVVSRRGTGRFVTRAANTRVNKRGSQHCRRIRG